MNLIKTAVKTFLFLFLIISFTSNDLCGQGMKDPVKAQDLLIKKPTPLQIIRGDTIKQGSEKDSVYMPGYTKYRIYTSFQDTNYVRALRIRIPKYSRFCQDLRLFSNYWRFTKQTREKTLMEIIRENMDIPPELFRPTGEQIVGYRTSINNALSIPLMRTNASFGHGILLSDIAAVVGITSECTPIMQYVVDYITDVEIRIYSVQATAVRTIFNKTHAPGSYSVTWDLLDDDGNRLPSGDYVGEVKLGNYKVIRNCIVIP